MTTETIVQVPLNQIVIDRSLQMRDEDTDSAFCETLIDALAAGEKLPPAVLFVEDYIDERGIPCVSYYIGDGWHRFFAHMQAQRPLPAVVHPGGRAAAFAYALGANADQLAKPRTRRDLRKAVTRAIEAYISGPDAEANTAILRKYTFSNGSCVSISKRGKVATQEEIAALCRTTQKTVSNIIRDLEKEAAAKDRKPEVRTGIDGKQYTVSASQLTFLDRLFQEVDPIAKIHNTFIHDGSWIDDSIPIEERIQGIQTWKDAMKRMIKDISDLEKALLKAKQNG